MDKLKAQLAVVTKHSFWILCGGILVVCLVSWYLSTKSLYEQQQKQLADITSVFKQMESLRGGNPKHPNVSTAEGMTKLIRAYSAEVADGWQLQYDQQADVLVWPESFDQTFRDRVNKLRPIEIVPPPPIPIDKDLELRERQLYRDFIADELHVLAETIGTIWQGRADSISAGGLGGSGDGSSGAVAGPGMIPGMQGGGFSGSGYPGSGLSGESGLPGADPLLEKSIVMWSATNQQELLSTHFRFISSEEPPSTLDVLYAQEDLWVLQNIMDIIKAANRDGDRDAVARHEAIIKTVDFVRIGRSAMGLAGRISPIGGQAAGSGYPGGSMMGPGMSSGGMGPGMGGMMGPGMSSSMVSPDGANGNSDSAGGSSSSSSSPGTAAVVSTDPAFGRYVDETYKPLDPKRLRDALTSKSPADALLAVAKRMPVRMHFTIDQRKLNKLLAECGNSRLPVEVRQLRVNREPAAAGGGGGYGGGYSGGSDAGYDGGLDSAQSGPSRGGMMGGMGGMGGYPGSSGMMSDGGSGMSGASGLPGAPRAVGGASSTAAIDLNLIDVELYGIVYIYNPVNKSQLGQEDATTTASAPAATTPTTTTPPATTPVSSPAPETTTPAATPVSSPAPTTPASTSVPPAAIVPGVGSGR